MTQSNSFEDQTIDQQLSTRDFRVIQDVFYQNAGIRLADRKKRMVNNRILKRMKELHMSYLGEYVDHLKSEKQQEEIVHLVNALTTNVTHFFRENHHFVHLEAEISKLIDGGANRIRIWSAGCSIGAEPYSMAITAYEVMRKKNARIDLKILATDIDTQALDYAQAGIYNRSTQKGLSKTMLQSHFERMRDANDEERDRVKNHIKRLITFNYLNLNIGRWPMKGPFDFIFCRNVLIYFDKQKQDEYLTKMTNLLRSDGYLYLGHSENFFSRNAGFEACGPTIYRKIPTQTEGRN